MNQINKLWYEEIKNNETYELTDFTVNTDQGPKAIWLEPNTIFFINGIKFIVKESDKDSNRIKVERTC